MEIITHPTSPYNQDYIYEMCNVGRPEELRLGNRGLDNLRQMYSKKDNKGVRNKKALAQFKARANRVPWDWE